MRLDALYQDVILDHYRNPRGRGLREPFDAEVSHRNPTCGDEITTRVAVVDGRLADVSYAGQGCSLSQASASVLHELLTGTGLARAARVHAGFLAMVHGEQPDEELLQDATALAGVAKYPMRVKCALLPWTALRDALVRAGAGDIGGPASDPSGGPGLPDPLTATSPGGPR